MENKKIIELAIVIFLIGLGVLARFLPHSPNFSPIMALALFAGVYLPKRLALIAPLVAFFVSDIFLGFYEISVMLSVYACFLLAGIMGIYFKKHKTWQGIGAGSVLSAVIFFLATNFAVWAFTPWYAKTFAGLSQCFLMALPFFKNTLLSNVFYAVCFFGLYEMIVFYFKIFIPNFSNLSDRSNLKN